MRLIPAVASYTGLQSQVKAALTEGHLALLARVAIRPVAREQLDETLVAELVEMHALQVAQGVAMLATTVFLEADILRVSGLADELGREMAQAMAGVGGELMCASPEVRNFLGGIIAAAQGPSQLLKATGKAVKWQEYGGRYPATKVDFDQDCPALAAVGPELQSKTLLRGEKYTAVFIGPGGSTYLQAVQTLFPPELRQFRRHLLRFLTDAFGGLLSGEQTSASLGLVAEEVGIYLQGCPRPILVTKELFREYSETVKRVADVSCRIYERSSERVNACLRETSSGKQGVPEANMIMHFGRYCRRALARQLYASGFFTDRVPSDGVITVFYENDIAELNAYFGQ